MRKELELETTAHPAAANFGSISLAAVESSAAKISLGAPSGTAAFTVMEAMFFGSGVLRFHLAACAYGLPAERSDAASHATSNHGCCSRIWINLWPTVPVAPRMPTGILLFMAGTKFHFSIADFF